MNSIRAGVAIALALGASNAACCAVFGPVTFGLSAQLNPPTSAQSVAFQRFDPALGTLRCVEVGAATTWSLSGSMTVFRIGTSAAGSAYSCQTGAVDLGGFDGTGFVTHAGASGPCQLVGGSLPAGGPNLAAFPFAIVGESVRTTLITSAGTMGAYTGAGIGGLYCRRYSGSQTGGSASPGYSIAGPNNPQYMADARFAIRYHYTPVNGCPGDVNSDGVVDFLDLNGVLASYAETGPCARGDVNNDGAVDFMDLNEILSYYGQTCVADASPSLPLTPPPAASTR